MERHGITAVPICRPIRTIAERRPASTPDFAGMDCDREGLDPSGIQFAPSISVATPFQLVSSRLDLLYCLASHDNRKCSPRSVSRACLPILSASTAVSGRAHATEARRAAVLRASVLTTHKRETWYREQLHSESGVVICHSRSWKQDSTTWNKTWDAQRS